MQDDKGNTPLHYACGYGRSALAGKLLEAGAKAAVENGSSQLPLDLITCAALAPAGLHNCHRRLGLEDARLPVQVGAQEPSEQGRLAPPKAGACGDRGALRAVA